MYVCTNMCAAHCPGSKVEIYTCGGLQGNGLQGKENQDRERSTGQMTGLGAAVQPMQWQEKKQMRPPIRIG
jgi:hypothetical protein